MKIAHVVSIAGLFFSGAAFCGGTDPDPQQLSVALTRYLAQRGDFCLGKYDWPIDVAPSDVGHTRDAVQMPVLEKLGLVESVAATATRKVGETEVTVEVSRYSLTDAGRKYFLEHDIPSASPVGTTVTRRGDLCAGKISLGRIVKWEPPAAANVDKAIEVTISYTYKFEAALWARDPEIGKVFPMIGRLLKGEGTMPLQQRMRLSDGGWGAINPWE